MKEISIPKKSGGHREIVVPTKAERKALRRLIPTLQEIAEAVDVHGVVHGFRRARSIVTNAEAHVGKQWTVSVDLKNFFDHVRKEMVPEVAARYPQCFYKDVAAQGLPTSPIVANIAAASMDDEIVRSLPSGCVYTRYADDLTVSGDDRSQIPEVLDLLRQIPGRHGFRVAKGKTRVQDSRYGRRIVTGIAVDDKLHMPRRLKRKLRAARHQGNEYSARGLEEFGRMKRPADDYDRKLRKRLRDITRKLRHRGMSEIEIMAKVAAEIELWQQKQISQSG